MNATVKWIVKNYETHEEMRFKKSVIRKMIIWVKRKGSSFGKLNGDLTYKNKILQSGTSPEIQRYYIRKKEVIHTKEIEQEKTM